jgi:hypothetical protein
VAVEAVIETPRYVFFIHAAEMAHDLCATCGSLGREEEGRLLFCVQCGEGHHPFCLKVSAALVDVNTFKCVECITCEECDRGDAEEMMLVCDVCHRGHHTFCLAPPLRRIPSGAWICDRCPKRCTPNAPLPGTLLPATPILLDTEPDVLTKIVEVRVNAEPKSYDNDSGDDIDEGVSRQCATCRVEMSRSEIGKRFARCRLCRKAGRSSTTCIECHGTVQPGEVKKGHIRCRKCRAKRNQALPLGANAIICTCGRAFSSPQALGGHRGKCTVPRESTKTTPVIRKPPVVARRPTQSSSLRRMSSSSRRRATSADSGLAPSQAGSPFSSADTSAPPTPLSPKEQTWASAEIPPPSIDSKHGVVSAPEETTRLTSTGLTSAIESDCDKPELIVDHLRPAPTPSLPSSGREKVDPVWKFSETNSPSNSPSMHGGYVDASSEELVSEPVLMVRPDGRATVVDAMAIDRDLVVLDSSVKSLVNGDLYESSPLLSLVPVPWPSPRSMQPHKDIYSARSATMALFHNSDSEDPDFAPQVVATFGARDDGSMPSMAVAGGESRLGHRWTSDGRRTLGGLHLGALDLMSDFDSLSLGAGGAAWLTDSDGFNSDTAADSYTSHQYGDIEEGMPFDFCSAGSKESRWSRGVRTEPAEMAEAGVAQSHLSIERCETSLSDSKSTDIGDSTLDVADSDKAAANAKDFSEFKGIAENQGFKIWKCVSTRKSATPKKSDQDNNRYVSSN